MSGATDQGTERLLRDHEAKTLRRLAEHLHGMTLVGGSPALTEALAAVTSHVGGLAEQVAAGGWSLHDRPAVPAGEGSGR